MYVHSTRRLLWFVGGLESAQILGSWDPQELWKPVPQGGTPRGDGAEGRPGELVYHAPVFCLYFPKNTDEFGLHVL